ncbi:hypothetical protein COV49_00200 [Candidatus Falkowbacteria bacterium CG11_big_fil_rev_8_21_14_0_20_39_10]|uniref:Uncharacterized protein n=1 Tax=Candidatus Falkowbacteria bacterium CG11_big_fil_rev_8_21_14_0_20_39_10 TaxID=1974570 RepID=A0A2M6KA85_9BACT|nr:MAG: hypothetical protein COV49_00200 [Candidatus Falkowbacteria bacterium CG11_big_fil_rev_8_21_14_0_20_39_10]
MQKKINGGATIWARQTIESEIFLYKPDKWFKIWFYIVNRAYFKEKNKFERGECFLKYSWIEEATGATKDQIYACVKWLKKERMLTTNKTTRGMHVKVLNYDKYQNFNNYKNDMENDNETIQKLQISDTILKKDNNINKDNKTLQAEPADNKNSDVDLKIPEKKEEAKPVVSENSSLPAVAVLESKSVPPEQIVAIIDLFRKISPSLAFGDKNQRKACSEVIKLSGFQEAENKAKYAISIQGKLYAPGITTPWELWKKLAKLENAKKRDAQLFTNTKSYGKSKQETKSSRANYPSAT